jgi:hypothetical protein
MITSNALGHFAWRLNKKLRDLQAAGAQPMQYVYITPAYYSELCEAQGAEICEVFGLRIFLMEDLPSREHIELAYDRSLENYSL